MELDLIPELQARLARIAAENNSETEGYVRELIERYLDHDGWFRQQVRQGLNQLDNEEFLTQEEIGRSLQP